MSRPHETLLCVMDPDGQRSIYRQPTGVRMTVYNGVCDSASSVDLLVERKADGTAAVKVVLHEHGAPVQNQMLLAITLKAPLT